MTSKTGTLKALFVFFIAFSLIGCADESELILPSIISDNMVLQHSSEVIIWGKAQKNTEVIIETSWGATAATKVRKDKSWSLKISTGNAGGPYQITIKNWSNARVINDVFLGEVWLASGQSNMEMPVAGWLPNDTIWQSEQTIANADIPEIRMFTVPKVISIEPLAKVDSKWQVCTPETVPGFSATAFYFARKLNAELNVPVGIIHSSWGGTNAESWVSANSLSNLEEFAGIVETLKATKTNIYDMWLQQFESIDITPTEDNIDPIVGIDLFDEHYSNPELSADEWDTISLPNNIESVIGQFDGAILFRKTINIPSQWAGKNLVLSLGAIDDRDVTWFNGEKIGATEDDGKWNVNRIYKIDGSKVKRGKSVITIRVIDTQGDGGISGNNLLKIYPEKNESSAISLAGEWQYNIIAELKANKLYLFNPEKNDFKLRPAKTVDIGPNTPSVLYNGMIAPIAPYQVKGAIWYQGESNVGRSEQYPAIMEKLVNNWRRDFQNNDFPFYFVQIAPYKYSNPESTESAWIREAQRRSLDIARTGMVVTLDIGNLENIHPANKIDVGERLALWALAKNYEKDITFSGPLFNGEFKVNGNKLSVSFDYTDGGLEIRKGVPNQFEIAGANGVYYPANAVISENKLVLSSSLVSKPVNARYAFKNGSQASLFNGAGLPASTFTTE